MIRIATAVLALIFLASGGAKLLQLEFETAAFARWGYPTWFMLSSGALEVAGALGLLAGLLRGPNASALHRLAAAGLALLMLGAIATHLRFAEWPMAAVASAICAGCACLAWRGFRPRRG